MDKATGSGSAPRNGTNTKEGTLIKGQDFIRLEATKVLLSKDTPLLTDAQDVAGAINELFSGGGKGGDESIIKPWIRPSDWTLIPAPADNQVIFLITTAWTTVPDCNIYLHPIEQSGFPANINASVDWGNGYTSTGKYEDATRMLWTNPHGRNGAGILEDVETNETQNNYAYNIYFDIANNQRDKVWTSGGTFLNDGSRVYVVTVTINCPEAVMVRYPQYPLEMHIGKNINICPAATNAYQYLQHVKAFGWQPQNNKYSPSTNGGLFEHSKVLKKIDTTDPFTEIPDKMFNDNTFIPEMDLSEVMKIGEQAFYMCFNSGIYVFDLPKCTEIKRQAFSNLFNFRFKINLPKLEILGEEAFNSCYGIAEIKLTMVTVIPKNCFRNCSFLQKIDAPVLTKIEDGGLQMCGSLTYVNMPKLEHLGTYGFYDCYNLREAIFPMLTYVGNGSFDLCYALEKLVCSDDADLSKASLRNSVLWYNNPQLSDYGRPNDIH